jgi:glycerol kinase
MRQGMEADIEVGRHRLQSALEFAHLALESGGTAADLEDLLMQQMDRIGRGAGFFCDTTRLEHQVQDRSLRVHGASRNIIGMLQDSSGGLDRFVESCARMADVLVGISRRGAQRLEVLENVTKLLADAQQDILELRNEFSHPFLLLHEHAALETVHSTLQGETDRECKHDGHGQAHQVAGKLGGRPEKSGRRQGDSHSNSARLLSAGNVQCLANLDFSLAGGHESVGDASFFARDLDIAGLDALAQVEERPAQGVGDSFLTCRKGEALRLAGNLASENGSVLAIVALGHAVIDRAEDERQQERQRDRSQPAFPPRGSRVKKLAQECSHPQSSSAAPAIRSTVKILPSVAWLRTSYLGGMDTILAIDQGTTGTTALLMDRELNRIAEASIDFEQHFPQPGWVEHDLEEIWSTVIQTVGEVTKHQDVRKLAAIGITNQRETLCFWDRKTGEPLARALVWQDRRTAAMCEALRSKGLEPFFQDNTGLLLDPYFSGTKAAWALKNWPEVARAQQQGRLAAGTIDSYLIARLSGGAVHATEPSNASRTLCFHLTRHEFDDDLCKALGVPREIWPEVRPSTGTFALTRGVPGIPDGVPITGVLGDQQAALLGQACTREGMAKCTYGTGAFMLMNTGKAPVKSRHRLLTTIAWKMPREGTVYALEGSAFIAGAAVQWLRDGLRMIRDSAEIEVLAESVPNSDGVVFVPALTGLGAPYWDPQATGMLTGLTRGTQAGHIARAVLEGIAFQNADILAAMQKDLGKPLASLNVDGGAAANNLLMQFQADVLHVKLRRPKYLETTSLGAVFAAGLGAGLWSDLSEIEKTWKQDRDFDPSMTDQQRTEAMSRWSRAIGRVTMK